MLKSGASDREKPCKQTNPKRPDRSHIVCETATQKEHETTTPGAQPRELQDPDAETVEGDAQT